MVVPVGLGIRVPDVAETLDRAEAWRANRLAQLVNQRALAQREALGTALAQHGGALFSGDPTRQMTALEALVRGGGPEALPIAMPFWQAARQPNPTRERNVGAQVVTEEFDPATRTWRAIGTAPRWQPQAAAQPSYQYQLGEDGQLYAIDTRNPRAAPIPTGFRPAPDPRAPEPLEAVMTPDGPRLVPRSAAAGAEPAPRSPQTVVNMGDNAFEREMGGVAAKAIADARAAAMTGVRSVQSAERVLELLPESITGPGADMRLLVARIGAALGAQSPAAAVRATQTLMAELSRGVLAQAESLKGVLSDRDMELLNRAAGGDISLDAGAIKRIAEISAQAGRQSVENYNALVGDANLPAAAARVFRPIQLPAGRAAPASRETPQSAPAEPAPPRPGQVIESGGKRWRFKGGDPAQRESWEMIE